MLLALKASFITFKKVKWMSEHTFTNFVVQLAQSLHVKSYLELGLDRCVTISSLKDKIPDCVGMGVDIMVQNKIGNFKYFEGTTNDFFNQYSQRFDLIFIDASHEYNQTLYDLNNSLNCLSDNPVEILIAQS